MLMENMEIHGLCHNVCMMYCDQAYTDSAASYIIFFLIIHS